MPHDIDMTTGKAAIFVTGQPAWHGLGTVIDKAATSAEAITLAGLDWHVQQWPVFASDPISEENISAPAYVANVRSDTKAVLGVVGEGYHVFQNKQAIDFFDAIVADKLAMFETAGAIKGGRKVWMLARIPKEYRAGSDDLIKPYVLLVNTHDGSMALRMIPTSVRVVCQNTLNLALNNAGSSEGIAIRHRPSLGERVKEAREKLGIIVARFDQFDEEMHAMLAKELTGKQVKSYFAGLLPEPPTERGKKNRENALVTIHTNFESGETNNLPGMRGTAWAAYNAVSQWADHQRQFRGTDTRGRAESRLNSVWFGASNDLKQKAYGRAMELANT